MNDEMRNLMGNLAEDIAREVFGVIDNERNDLIYGILDRAESTAMQMKRAGFPIADGLVEEVGRLFWKKVIQARKRVYEETN